MPREDIMPDTISHSAAICECEKDHLAGQLSPAPQEMPREEIMPEKEVADEWVNFIAAAAAPIAAPNFHSSSFAPRPVQIIPLLVIPESSEALHRMQVDMLAPKIELLLPTLPSNRLTTALVQAQLEQALGKPPGRLARFQQDIMRIWKEAVRG